MLRLVFLFSLLAQFMIPVASRAGNIPVQEGDILFQTFPSPQTDAIEIATRSRYSHVGLVLRHDGGLVVYEAVGPVTYTPLESWIKRNDERHFAVKRLGNAATLLTKANLIRLESVAATFAGKPYDFEFKWSDDKIYCSELVWKTFHRALHLDVGKLRKFGEFDLSSSVVQEALHERFPKGAPLEETVVSPEDIFESPLLVMVYQQ